jgi:hypothetical protein
MFTTHQKYEKTPRYGRTTALPDWNAWVVTPLICRFSADSQDRGQGFTNRNGEIDVRPEKLTEN